jgi:putative intracellular protease/amidase
VGALALKFASSFSFHILSARASPYDSVKQESFDTVFYPGGHGPMWDLAEDKNSAKLIESFLAAGKPIALVCHSPGALRHVKTPDGESRIAAGPAGSTRGTKVRPATSAPATELLHHSQSFHCEPILDLLREPSPPPAQSRSGAHQPIGPVFGATLLQTGTDGPHTQVVGLGRGGGTPAGAAGRVIVNAPTGKFAPEPATRLSSKQSDGNHRLARSSATPLPIIS